MTVCPPPETIHNIAEKNGRLNTVQRIRGAYPMYQVKPGWRGSCFVQELPSRLVMRKFRGDRCNNWARFNDDPLLAMAIGRQLLAI